MPINPNIPNNSTPHPISERLLQDADGFIHEATKCIKKKPGRNNLAKYTNFTKCRVKPKARPRSTRVETTRGKFTTKTPNSKPKSPNQPTVFPNPPNIQYDYDQIPAQLEMRKFRTGWNPTHPWRRYYADHFINRPHVDYDNESHDPASDSSAFESYWEEDPPPEGPPAKFYECIETLLSTQLESQ